ncbi:hypothetical protein HPB48_026979 [Haemaphysalis longicornis]|uniref:DDE Tnp4 domain-containing protein n=1 Tax=Haemaphysalis longicornis TaxID=44386 RepID=A0A9J6HC43_HAELO|nr:hypothetical protein HPB48_026979 [Haemaphysalis longicornis]
MTEMVMADNGFRIEDLLEKNGTKLNLPPFLKGVTLSPEEVKSTKEIAALRIHVERRIQRIKVFDICDRPIPLPLAPYPRVGKGAKRQPLEIITKTETFGDQCIGT